MTKLPFRRVLLGALLGALAMIGILMLISGLWLMQDWAWAWRKHLGALVENPCPLHRWIFPLGAVVGIRLAVGKGGTARWAALLPSVVLWWLFMWVYLEWSTPVWAGLDFWYASNLLSLLGGWAVLVWRAMEKLEGVDPSVEALPLTLIGIFVANLIQGVLVQLLNRFAFSWILPDYLLASIVGILLALMLVGGLGSMAALAGRLDVRWGNACMSAGLISVVMAGGWLRVRYYGPAWLDSQDPLALGLLFKLAWFSWWGWRLAKPEQGD